MAFEFSDPKDLAHASAFASVYYTTADVSRALSDLVNMLLNDVGVDVALSFNIPSEREESVGLICVDMIVHKKVMADWLETQQGVY